MTKLRELKNERNELNRNIHEVRAELESLVTSATFAVDEERYELLDKIQSVNEVLNTSLAKLDLVSAKIKSRRATGKTKKKVRKVHNVAGRSIDPTSFSGIVSGGLPGGGKRR